MPKTLTLYTAGTPNGHKPAVYLNETKRLWGVLEIRLQQGEGREYLAGPGKGKYSIADINAFTWVRLWEFSGVENLDDFPGVLAWLARIQKREAVAKGLDVPPKA